MADGFEIKRLDELESMEGSGNSTWHLVRKGIECPAFGINLVEIGPGGQIPEHTEEERDHEEVFIVLDGDAVAIVDGMEQPAPKGTFVRVSPAVRRQIRNQGSDTTRIVIVAAPRSSGYEPMGWG